MAEDFLLKWNDHHKLFFAGAEQLYQGEEFTDVVISAGNQTFRAHKLVLSICSPYFQNLFRKLGPEKHVIFLKDISAKHLELLLQYMYVGEIKVQEDELVTVLNVAQSLEIRGLTDNSEPKQTPSSSNTRSSAVLPAPVKRKSPPPQSSSVQTVKKPRPMEQQRAQPFTPSLVKMEHDTTPVIDIEVCVIWHRLRCFVSHFLFLRTMELMEEDIIQALGMVMPSRARQQVLWPQRRVMRDMRRAMTREREATMRLMETR